MTATATLPAEVQAENAGQVAAGAATGSATPDRAGYRERPGAVAGTVVWRRTGVPGTTQRILPDGCMDVIWADGVLFVAGPDSAAALHRDTDATTYTGLRLAPGTGPAVFGVPADDLLDRRVALDDLWDAAETRALADRLASGTTPGRDLERAVAARCRRDRPALVEPLAPAIVAALIPRGGAVAGGADSRMSPPWAALAGDPEARNSVARTAAMVGLSERQLRRRCRTAFGYGPKTLARILRLRHAVGLARAGVPFVVVAGLAGYADQAHLAREVRALAGVPLGGLLGATSPDAAGSAATSPPAA